MFAVDIGNTNITCGVVQDGKIIRSWRLSTHPHKTTDEYAFLFSQLLSQAAISDQDIADSAVSCVVPPILEAVTGGLHSISGSTPFVIKPGILTNFNVCYNKPRDVGADRIVNAAAGKHLYGYPLIIVDSGTATTFCILDEAGDYCGGLIFPGIYAVSDSLFKSTALLPKVAINTPQTLIGTSTVTSMQSGLFFGFLEAIEGLIRRIHTHFGKNIRVVGTGGLISFIQPSTAMFDAVDPDLTLKGLDFLYRFNKNPSKNSIPWAAE